MSSVHHLPDKRWLASFAPADIELEVGVVGQEDAATLVFLGR
jgi:hypothetical protein